MSRVYSVSELREYMYPVFAQYGVKRAILFGSYGKGSADEKSDIDLLVDSGLRGLRFVSLCEDLRRSIDKEVDLFDVTHVEKGSKLDREIEKNGVVIHEK